MLYVFINASGKFDFVGQGACHAVPFTTQAGPGSYVVTYLEGCRPEAVQLRSSDAVTLLAALSPVFSSHAFQPDDSFLSITYHSSPNMWQHGHDSIVAYVNGHGFSLDEVIVVPVVSGLGFMPINFREYYESAVLPR